MWVPAHIKAASISPWRGKTTKTSLKVVLIDFRKRDLISRRKKKQFINMLLVVGDGADVSRKVGMEFSFAICNFG